MKKLIPVLIWLCLASVADAATRYISPSGSNSNNGQSTSTPWLTFAHAFANTSCGDTLLLMNGTYGDGTSTGLLDIRKVCTAGNEYTIRALNSRQAKIQDTTGNYAVLVWEAAYIILDGLYGASVDNTDFGNNTSGKGNPSSVRFSHHITVKNGVWANPNRYSNTTPMGAFKSQDVLFEDNEAYVFHRHCLTAWQSERITVRRQYCNPRGGRIAGSFNSGNGLNTADSVMSMYPCKDCILENAIADGTTSSMFMNEMNATFGSGVLMSGSKVLGSICYKCSYETSIYMNSRNALGINNTPQNILVRDFATIDYDPNSGQGIRVSDGVNITLDHITILSNPSVNLTTQHGITTDNPSTTGTTNVENSVAISNVVVRGVKDRGMNITGFNTWTANSIISNSNGTNYNPSSSANYTNTSTVDPAYGLCKGLWVPAGAPGKGTGVSTRTSLGHNDIGATILYRYVDGVLTDIPLWDTVTKAFPFGAATADGINRVAGQSLFDIHVRLKVGDADCPFPAGYVGGSGGGGGGGGAGNTPSNPANHASGSGTTSASWSHTISGQGLLVAVAAYDSNGNVGTINTPTSCGGQSVTALPGGEVVSSPPYRRIKLFGITSPTAGSCTISTSVTGAADTVVGESVDIAAMGSFGTPAVATGLSASPSVTVPTDNGETVYAFVGTKCLPSGGVCTTTYDVGPDETWLKDTAGVSDLRLASASQSGNKGGAVTATVGSNNYWTIAGVSIIPGTPDPPSGATLTISRYRIYDGDGTESGAVPIANVDTPASIARYGMARIRAQVTGSGATTNPIGVSLYCRRNADPFTKAMNTFGSNTFRLFGPAAESESNPIPATNTPTTEQLTTASGVFVPGKVYNDANASVVIPSLAVGQQTEIVSNVVFDTTAGTMECQYYTDGGVPIPADTGKVPTLTMREPNFSLP